MEEFNCPDIIGWWPENGFFTILDLCRMEHQLTAVVGVSASSNVV